MLHCSFPLVAAQLLVKMTSALQVSECCSATSAAQLSRNLQRNFRLLLWHAAGWGLEGWGLGLPDARNFGLIFRSLEFVLFFDPDVMQSGFGVKFLFWPANFRKVVGECLSEF